MPSSPGCWAVFGELLAREFSDPAYFAVHQLTVDSYGASHPGEPERRAIQALGLQLMTLQLFLEEGVDAGEGPRLHRSIVRRPPAFAWLDPPDFQGRMTAADVLEATSVSEHVVRVRSWANAIWMAWTPHHPTIREWVKHSVGS